MKTMIYAVVLAIGLLACAGEKQNEEVSEAEATKEVANTKSNDLVDAYMQLKDALVNTDAGQAQTAAQALSEALSNNKFGDSLIAAANTIAEAEDVGVQREAFKTITDGMISSLKANGTEEGLFVQYCPMAFDDTGASWLSTSEEIRNPYFGDKMLKCGQVTGKI